MRAAGRDVALICHVTVETTGTMLVGSEIGAALTALEAVQRGRELVDLVEQRVDRVVAGVLGHAVHRRAREETSQRAPERDL